MVILKDAGILFTSGLSLKYDENNTQKDKAVS